MRCDNCNTMLRHKEVTITIEGADYEFCSKKCAQDWLVNTNITKVKT